MTIEEFEAKYRTVKSPPLKSYGVKSKLDLLAFSQLDDKQYSLGLNNKRDWVETVAQSPFVNYQPEFWSYCLGQFVGYNDLSWLTEDEFDILLEVIKPSLTGGYALLGKITAFFGGLRGKDHYWFTEFCKNNRFTQNKLERYYTAGTNANLDKEFETLNGELAYEY